MGTKKTLRWRVTCMSLWREHRDYTQVETAEALGRPPYNIETTYVSIGRYERGEVAPPANMLEAIAALYRTNVHSLLNERPVPFKKTG